METNTTCECGASPAPHIFDNGMFLMDVCDACWHTDDLAISTACYDHNLARIAGDETTLESALAAACEQHARPYTPDLVRHCHAAFAEWFGA